MKQCRFTSIMIECLIFVRECILHTTDFISNSQNNLTRGVLLPPFSDKVSEAERGHRASGGGRAAHWLFVAAFIYLLIISIILS